MIRIETLNGQMFIEITCADGVRRSYDPLTAIGMLNAETHAHESKLMELRILTSDEQQAIRRAVLNGRDSQPHRTRIEALEIEQRATANDIANAHRIAAQIRQAVIDADAGQMLTKAIATQSDALSPLSTEAYQ